MPRIGEISYPRWYGIGKAETNDPTELRGLTTSQDSVTGGRYDSLERPRGTDYVVPAGKKLYITRVLWGFAPGAVSAIVCSVGYGDDAVNNSASAPTNFKVLGVFAFRTGEYVKNEYDVWLEVPAGKYPAILAGGIGTDCIVLGIEV